MSDIVERLRLACAINLNTATDQQLTELLSEGMNAAETILALRKEVEVARAALREAESVFALVESPSFTDPDYQSRIETLGSDIGYGALMAGASAAWRKCGIIPGGEFVAGPCQATVTRTLEIIRAALATEPVK